MAAAAVMTVVSVALLAASVGAAGGWRRPGGHGTAQTSPPAHDGTWRGHLAGIRGRRAQSVTVPSVSPSPSPAHPPGLNPHLIDLTIQVSPDAFRAGASGALLAAVNAQLNQDDPGHRLVGFVIVLATDDLYHVNRGTATATQVLNLLRRRSPDFSVAQGLGYWNGPGADSEFKIFLLN